MEFKDLITRRRSIRTFTDEQLTPDELAIIMRAALLAPSSKGQHSYEFVVVDEKEKLTALSQTKNMGADLLQGAAVAIVVMANPETSDVWIEDASVASTFILCQAEDLGLGACWVQIRERADAGGNDAEQNVRNILGIPETLRVVSVIGIGHKATERKPQNEDKIQWEKVHINAF